MEWQEVRITINQMASEALANIMEELGAKGVIFKENENRVELTAYYPVKDFTHLLSKLKERAASLVDYGLKTGEIDIAVRLTRDQDWSTSWHKFFKPLALGDDFLVCPSWEICETKKQIIELDPGMAFGVGSHETTKMCVEMLEKYVNKNTENLLDIGTGTGILAIIAAKLGVKEILGIDIDSVAVEVAQQNIVKNKVEQQVKIKQGDLFKKIQDTYSMIVANIIPNILLELIPEVASFLKKDGLFILSGIVLSKEMQILESLADNNFCVVEEKKQGEWLSFLVVKG